MLSPQFEQLKIFVVGGAEKAIAKNISRKMFFWWKRETGILPFSLLLASAVREDE